MVKLRKEKMKLSVTGWMIPVPVPKGKIPRPDYMMYETVWYNVFNPNTGNHEIIGQRIPIQRHQKH